MKDRDTDWLLREKYGGEKSYAFFADLKCLAAGEPLAYLIGWTPFLDCKIHLDSHPLIPRPETEYWTEEAITAIQGGASLPLGFAERPLRILDLCAGSGCIGVAVAKAVPAAVVEFGELDARHLPTIKKNLIENGIDLLRTNLVHTNLFSNLPGRYDFILANPPYIDQSLDRTDDSVKEHEPYVALFGGRGGLEVIAQLITDAPRHLAPSGQLWLEHEPEQTAAIHELAGQHSLTATTRNDQYGVERYSILVLQ